MFQLRIILEHVLIGQGLKKSIQRGLGIRADFEYFLESDRFSKSATRSRITSAFPTVLPLPTRLFISVLSSLANYFDEAVDNVMNSDHSFN